MIDTDFLRFSSSLAICNQSVEEFLKWIYDMEQEAYSTITKDKDFKIFAHPPNICGVFQIRGVYKDMPYRITILPDLMSGNTEAFFGVIAFKNKINV